MRCGYRPTRGQLTLAFVNAEAYSNWDPSSPGTTRFVDEDMNRVWTHEQLDSRTDESSDLERARALRPFYDRVDPLLDIHSMGGNHAPIMLCHGDQKQRAFAAQVGFPEFVGCGEGFVGEGKSRLIEYPPFQEQEEKVAMLVECGSHWKAETGVVAVPPPDRLQATIRELGCPHTDVSALHRWT